MSEELVHRMGVNASSTQGGEAGTVPNGLAVDSCSTPFRETIGVVVR